MEEEFVYIDQYIRAYHNRRFTGAHNVFAAYDRPFYRLYHVLSGGSTFYVDGNSYHAGPGDILLFDSGEVCRQVLDPFVEYERVVVNFYPEMVDSFDPTREMFRPFLLSAHRGRHLLHTDDFPDFPWREVSLQMTKPEKKPRLNVYSSFFRLCSAVSSVFDGLSADAPVSDRDRLVQDTVQYLNDHLTEPLNIETLVRTLKVSSSTLYSRFTASVGVPIRQYVTTRRMSMARELLGNGLSAQEVCARCGYTEYSTFFRAFRKQFGFSPSEIDRHKEDRFY